MESADNPKSVNGQEKAEISDQTNRFQNKTNPDCFIIDVDSFSNSITSKEISQNSRITRNLSRKGMLRGGNKIGQDHGAGDDTAGESISPIGGVVGGSGTLEKQAVVVGLGPREEVGSGGGNGGGGGGALSHEIAITTVHGSGGAERQNFRRNSFKRSTQPCSWYLDPRKIFLFCATLSCVGTMLLIYFAFSSGMVNVEERRLDS